MLLTKSIVFRVINFRSHFLDAPEITTSSEYRGAVGKKASLVCTVDANPPPTSVLWTGPNGRSSNGSVLEIQSVSLMDMGNYTCTAKNMLNVYLTGSVPRSSTKTTTLIVDHRPGKAIISTIEPVVAGSTANLSCTADDIGSPVAQFRWKAPGQQEFEHASRSTYTIYDVQMTHAGNYSCLPWNSIDQGEVGMYKLVVYGIFFLNFAFFKITIGSLCRASSFGSIFEKRRY